MITPSISSSSFACKSNIFSVRWKSRQSFTFSRYSIYSFALCYLLHITSINIWKPKMLIFNINYFFSVRTDRNITSPWNIQNFWGRFISIWRTRFIKSSSNFEINRIIQSPSRCSIFQKTNSFNFPLANFFSSFCIYNSHWQIRKMLSFQS